MSEKVHRLHMRYTHLWGFDIILVYGTLFCRARTLDNLSYSRGEHVSHYTTDVVCLFYMTSILFALNDISLVKVIQNLIYIRKKQHITDLLNFEDFCDCICLWNKAFLVYKMEIQQKLDTVA